MGGRANRACPEALAAPHRRARRARGPAGGPASVPDSSDPALRAAGTGLKASRVRRVAVRVRSIDPIETSFGPVRRRRIAEATQRRGHDHGGDRGGPVAHQQAKLGRGERSIRRDRPGRAGFVTSTNDPGSCRPGLTPMGRSRSASAYPCSSGEATTLVISLVLADDEQLPPRCRRRAAGHGVDLQVVAAASTSTEALAAIRTHRPDIALLDVEMSDGDGAPGHRARYRPVPVLGAASSSPATPVPRAATRWPSVRPVHRQDCPRHHARADHPPRPPSSAMHKLDARTRLEAAQRARNHG